MPFNYTKISGESSTDDDASNHQCDTTRNTFWSRISRKLAIIRWPITLFFLIVVTACQLAILHNQPGSLQVGSELNGILPLFSQHNKVFQPDDRYISDHITHASINSTKKHWMDLMPRGGGFINVLNPTQYTLPPPMLYTTHPNTTIYTIAVFHQLHCLYHLSHSLDTLALKIRARNFNLEHGMLSHNDHCIAYLRSTVMCCGDTTLEGQAQSEGFKHFVGTDGMGGTHVCRDFEEVRTWAEGKRVVDEKEAL